MKNAVEIDSIEINVAGSNLEIVPLVLNKAQVENLYVLNKSLTEANIKLEKDLASEKSSYKYASDARSELDKEISQANAVFDALGIEKEIEKQYGTEKIGMTGRIALLIKHLSYKQ